MVSRKTLILDYKVCIGLCAYLRQIELSLDRALPNDINGINSYFKEKGNYNIEEVIRFLENIASHKMDITYIRKCFIHNETLSMKWSEIMIIIICLKRTLELINNNSVNEKEFINMRMLLPKIAWDYAERKMNKKSKRLIYLVDFYNSSHTIKKMGIDELLGERWIS